MKRSKRVETSHRPIWTRTINLEPFMGMSFCPFSSCFPVSNLSFLYLPTSLTLFYVRPFVETEPIYHLCLTLACITTSLVSPLARTTTCHSNFGLLAHVHFLILLRQHLALNNSTSKLRKHSPFESTQHFHHHIKDRITPRPPFHALFHKHIPSKTTPHANHGLHRIHPRKSRTLPPRTTLRPQRQTHNLHNRCPLRRRRIHLQRVTW
jgi:hypothetical protein